MVLVTGAGTGIGRGIAMGFAKAGAAVALHYSSSSKGAEDAVVEILKHGGRAAAFKADFAKLKPIREMAREAVAFLGGLDVVVNNAGITMNMRFEKVMPEQFNVLYSVYVRAPFFLAQAVLPELEKFMVRSSIFHLSTPMRATSNIRSMPVRSEQSSPLRDSLPSNWRRVACVLPASHRAQCQWKTISRRCPEVTPSK